MKKLTSKYKWEVAAEYNISMKTLWKWLIPFLPDLEVTKYNKNSRIFTPAQLKIIYEKLGDPDNE